MSVGLRPDDRDPPAPRWPEGRVRRARAVVEALLADRDARGALVAPPAAECDRLVGEFALWVASGSNNVLTGFRLFFVLLEILPPFVVGRLAPMTRLSLAERVAYFEALEGSRLGLLASLFVAVKLPLCALAYEGGDSLSLTGFDRTGIAVRRLPVAGAGATPAGGGGA
ncbi:MAG TPA: hypothetical protein VFS43_42910 [Polyangiaceae bacterium]|nr:hypothetical protein [Polyangiaceae bacterium]